MEIEQKIVLFHGFENSLFDRLARGVKALLPEGAIVTLAAVSPDLLSKTVEVVVMDLLKNPGQIYQDNPIVAPEKMVIYIHGFPRDELYALVNGLKMLLPDRKAVAFCTSTKNNISMVLLAMIEEVLGDHAYMTRPRPATSEES